MKTKTNTLKRSLVAAVGLSLAGIATSGYATNLPLLGLLSGNNVGLTSLGLGSSGGGGIAGLGVLSGQNSGSGGLLGLDIINNDSLLGTQLGGATLIDLGDIADPLADGAQALGAQIRSGSFVLTQLPGLPGAEGIGGQALDLSPITGLALGSGADATGNLAGLGLATGNGAFINPN